MRASSPASPNSRRQRALDRQTSQAIAAECSVSSQQVGRDVAQNAALLSDLRDTAPFTHLARRVLYRVETALESVSNRIYALLAASLILLAASLVFFVGVALLSNEYDHLQDAANGYGDDEPTAAATWLFAVWLTWCFFIDPGSHTDKLDPMKYTWGRGVAALISLLGVIFFSFVLGFVVDLMQSFVARVSEGRSSVIEDAHYLILGYSEKCVAVIGELATAMESDGGGVVVVLADYPTKAEFDVLMAAHLAALGLQGTRVVFRPGSPLMTSRLLRVSPETSRAIVVLSDTRQDADHADAMVLRIILSLKSILGQNAAVPTPAAAAAARAVAGGGGADAGGAAAHSLPPGSVRAAYRGHVVAELRDNDNKPIIEVSGGSLVELVVVHDIIGRMLAKATVQPNIRRIYDDLLGFDGCEFYFAPCPPALAGRSVRDASLRLRGAVLVGLKRGPDIMLNPESSLPQSVGSRAARRGSGSSVGGSSGSSVGGNGRDSGGGGRDDVPRIILEEGDEIIVIAEDDSSYEVLDRPIFDDASPLKRPWPPKHGERSARDALEAAEEEKAAAEAVEASAADAAANVGLNKSPVRPARKAWATADGGGEAGSGEAGGGGDGAPIDGLGGGGGAPSQSIGDGDRSGQGTSSVATVAHTAASPPVASPPPIRRLRHEGLRVLLCGWRRDVKDMLLLMEQVLPPGSTVRILSERPPAFVDEYLADHCSTFTRVTVLHAYGRADVRRRLVESNALGFDTVDEVDVVVVVADELKEKDVLLSDSQTIATCLLVRDVQADHRENRDVSLADLSVLSLESLQVACPMTAEILDVATRATIEENPAIKAIADFIVVNDLAARLIAAVADRREVASVLGQLLGPDPKSQDIFVVEASALLYPNELVASRAAACVDVGDGPPRPEASLRKLARALSYKQPEPTAGALNPAHNPISKASKHGSEGTALDGPSVPPFSPPPRGTSGRSSRGPPAAAAALRAQRSSWMFNSSAKNIGGDDDGDGDDDDDDSDRARPVSFAELAWRASQPPRHALLLGYVKATWDAKGNRVGELSTVFNPQAKGAPLYWHPKDFLLVMSITGTNWSSSAGTLTVVR